VNTYEVALVQRAKLLDAGLVDQMTFQMSLWEPVNKMMDRGVLIDMDERRVLKKQLTKALLDRKTWFQAVLGYDFNPNSTPQMKALFYDTLGLRPKYSRKTSAPTLDAQTLNEIMVRVPLLTDLIQNIIEYRSARVFLSTFVEASLAVNHTIHCSFNVAGTTTFRFTSSRDAFDRGGNLMNIPDGKAYE